MSKIIDEIRNSSIGQPVCQDGKWEVLYCFKNTFSGFSGHFPSNPVLPGVLQIQAALEAIKSVTGEVELVETTRVKFKGMVAPDSILKVQWSEKQGEDIFKCILSVEQELVSSFNLKAVAVTEQE